MIIEKEGRGDFTVNGNNYSRNEIIKIEKLN